MPRVSIQEYFTVSRLTPARRRMALERVGSIAHDLALLELEEAILASIEVQDEAVLLEQQRRDETGEHAIHADGAPEADADLDRAVNGLYDSLSAIARSFKGAVGQRAQGLLDTCFPHGAGGITHLPYVDQNAAVLRLTDQLREPAHSATVALLSLGHWVTLLDQLNEAYGQLLVRPGRVTHAEVQAADRAGWVSLVSVVALITGLYPTDLAADLAARSALMEPIEGQEAALSLLRARRRGEGPPREEGVPPEVVPVEGDFPEETGSPPEEVAV